jgi:hypothetical protein
MSGTLAIVCCVHHKPWLMMATALTLVSQEHQEADLFFAYNVGDGESPRESYRQYRDLAARAGVNAQLSPFDERVRDVCALYRDGVFELEYENDHALDSGTWYKFIRDGRWRDYEYVLFLGEGTLLAHPRLLSGLLGFAGRRQVHFIASGHEKRRVPRPAVAEGDARLQGASTLDALHDQMVAETFDVFCRDPEFRAVFDTWGSGFPAETEHHVPGITGGGVTVRTLRARIQRRWDSPFTHPGAPWPGRWIRRVPHLADYWLSRASMVVGRGERADGPPMAYVGGGYDARPLSDWGMLDTEGGVTFHRVDGPEWFGCAANHLMSRTFLERLAGKLDLFSLYDVLDLPFAGTGLEIVWGFLPAWLGFEKWFTNGLHRVRKHFATYQREDYPPEMASYINRYHRGRLAVGWQGDYLKLRAWRSDLGELRRILPAAYF